MPKHRVFRPLSLRLATLLVLATFTVHSPSAQSSSATQSDDPPDVKAYREAMRLVDPQRRIEALDRFLVAYPKSRYAATIPNYILDLLIKGGQKEKILARANRIIEDAPENGKSQAYYAVAAKFLGAGILLDEAEGFAAKAVSTLKEGKYVEFQRQTYQNRGQDPPPDEIIRKRFNSTRATYLATLGQLYFKNGRDVEAEKAFKDARKADPKLAAATIGLAKIASKSGDEARAFEMIAEAALSGRITREARQMLEELYRKTHGGALDGLEEALDERYRRAFPNPVRVKGYKRSRGDRVALAEVFTGSGCPPCVAADLAFDAAMERYERRDLAVLMYHLHIPRPDPMTNAATQKRASFYRVRGVPTYIIDGRSDGGGGSREAAEMMYNRLKSVIEKRLEVPAQAEIKLDAALDGGKVKVRVTVDRIDSPSPGLKLNVALVEKMLRYGGENGVRFHPMVVRALGGPDANGYRLRGAKAAFEHVFDLARLKGELKAFLDSRERLDPDFEFSEKKHAIDPANLALVAFVQDEANLEILQANYVDVRPGSMELKAPTGLAAPPASKPSDNPADNPDDAPPPDVNLAATSHDDVSIESLTGFEPPPPPPTRDEELRREIARRQAELQRWKNTGNAKWEAETLHQIGADYFSLGDKRQALDYYQQALQRWRALKDRNGEAKALNSLGAALHSQGERSQALEYYRQAIEIRRSAGDRNGEIETLNNLGRLYSEMGQREEAIAHYQQSLALLQTQGDRVGKADSLHRLGEAYEASGDRSKAREFYRQSLQLWQAMGKTRNEAHLLNHLGAIHSAMDEKREALDYYQQALRASRAAKASDEEAIALKQIERLSSSADEKRKN